MSSSNVKDIFRNGQNNFINLTRLNEAFNPFLLRDPWVSKYIQVTSTTSSCTKPKKCSPGLPL